MYTFSEWAAYLKEPLLTCKIPSLTVLRKSRLSMVLSYFCWKTVLSVLYAFLLLLFWGWHLLTNITNLQILLSLLRVRGKLHHLHSVCIDHLWIVNVLNGYHWIKDSFRSLALWSGVECKRILLVLLTARWWASGHSLSSKKWLFQHRTDKPWNCQWSFLYG